MEFHDQAMALTRHRCLSLALIELRATTVPFAPDTYWDSATSSLAACGLWHVGRETLRRPRPTRREISHGLSRNTPWSRNSSVTLKPPTHRRGLNISTCCPVLFRDRRRGRTRIGLCKSTAGGNRVTATHRLGMPPWSRTTNQGSTSQVDCRQPET